MVHFARKWGLHTVACLAAIIFAAVVGPSFSAFNLKAFQGTTNPPPPPPPPHPCPDCDNPDATCPPNGSPNGQGNGQGQGGKHPVCYGTGENFLNISELRSTGLSGWKHGRSFLSDTAYADGLMGPGWRATGQMQLVQKNGFVVLVSGNSSVRTFTQSGSTYTETMFYQDTLVVDAVNHTLVFTSTNGSQWTFFDFSGSWGVARQGHLKQFTDAAGNLLTTVYSTTAGPTLDKILEVDQTDTNPQLINRFVYAYNLSGVASGQLSSVTYQRSVSGVVTTVRRVDYTYYATGGPNGPAGTLQWAKVSDGTNVLDVYYHRYNALDGQGRLPLRYVLGPTGYERARASLVTDAAIDAASDATIAQWASHYFEYDSSLRVTKEIVQGQGCGCGTAGGKGTFTYAYTTSALTITDQYNNWLYKTVETLPDGNQNIVYTTPAGATILFAFKEVSSGRQWITFTFHDSQGREYSSYTPSAVASYNEASPSLSVTTNSGGLGIGRNFYGATNLPLGQVAGYQFQTSIQAVGVSLTTTSVTTYTSRSGASGTIYPVASQTVYRNEDGTGPITTSFSYTWQGSSDRILQKTTTNPVVSTAQNGSNAATSTIVQYDAFGRQAWTKDDDGYIQNVQYDPLTGAITTRIVDVNTTTNPGPAGWVTPAGGGLNLTTTIVVDSLGRATKVTDPGLNITYKVYDDTLHQTRVYPGWNTTTNLPTGPTLMIREDRPGSYRESLTMSATPAVTGGVPTGTEAVSGLQTLSRDYLDTGDRVTSTSSYFNFSGLTYSTTPVIGTLGTHFYQANFNYDVKGRKDRSQTWDGTIARTVYDSLDRVSSVWIGTDDTPTTGDWSPTNTAGTNLIMTDASEYDSNGVGNGYLTRSRHFTSAGVSLDVVYQRDYRGRELNRRGADNVAVNSTYDNLDRVTMIQTYADANANFTIDSGELRGKTQTSFDEKGQVYQTVRFNVDPSTGAVGDSLTTNRWSSGRGLSIKIKGPNGEFTKTQYDGARRQTATFVSFDDAETLYSDASQVTGDRVVDEAVTFYDAASNVIQTTRYQRTSTSTQTGDLATSWTAAKSRRTFVARWFDLANRRTDAVDYGNNGGSAFTRPSIPPAPNTSNNYHVTHFDFDAGGRQYKTTDNLARVTQQTFDGLSRVTQSVENFSGTGVPVETDLDVNRTTQFVFDSVGRFSQRIALNPKGTGLGVESQITQYVYGTIANQATPPVYRNDIRVAEIYPDSDDTYTPGNPAGSQLGNGVGGVYDRVEFTYDYASRRSTLKEQRGTVHTYAFDTAGRFSSDTVTTLPTGVDGSVLRTGKAYDSLSREQLLTSYSDTGGATIVNQVKLTYDGWGNTIKDEQEHVGAVVSGTTASYQIAYADGSSGGVGKYLRPVSMTYPNGRAVYFNYPAAGSTSVGEHLSRIDNIANDSAGTSKFAQYTYLGTNVIGQINHPLVTNGLELLVATGGNPVQWDNFGRILDQEWKATSGSVIHDRYKHTYDGNSNRLTRDTLATGAPTTQDQFYTYDNLDRLNKLNRGTLASGQITDTKAKFSQKWTALESQGNWRGFQVAPTGANNYTFQQARVHNKANEIDVDNSDANAAGASITGVGGADWIDPTYDKGGNLVSYPQVGTETVRQWATYDAWNRLVKVQNDNSGSPGTEIAEYQYDARGWRVVKLVPNGSNWNRTDYYYTCTWQCVEERTLTNTPSKTTAATIPHFQWVWDLRYIDAVLLRDENKDGDNSCTGAADQRIFYTHDANFNTTALVDTTGAVVERYVYDAYGVATVLSGSWASQSTTLYNNEILFAGYHKDPETSVYLARHRSYHPTIGQWMRRDPLGYHDGSSLSEFVHSRPTVLLDPLGLYTTWEWKPFVSFEYDNGPIPMAGPAWTGYAGDADIRSVGMARAWIMWSCNDEGNVENFKPSDISEPKEGVKRNFFNFGWIVNGLYRTPTVGPKVEFLGQSEASCPGGKKGIQVRIHFLVDDDKPEFIVMGGAGGVEGGFITIEPKEGIDHQAWYTFCCCCDGKADNTKVTRTQKHVKETPGTRFRISQVGIEGLDKCLGGN